MRFHVRYWALALTAALYLGPAAAAESGRACRPEFAIDGVQSVYDVKWCGNGAVLYGTRYGLSRSTPALEWVNLETGESRRFPLKIETESKKELFAGFSCSPDGKWAFYSVAGNHGKGRIVGMSIEDGRTVIMPLTNSLSDILPSPDGRKLLYRTVGLGDTQAFVTEKMSEWPYWELIALPDAENQFDIPVAWLPDSQAFRVRRICRLDDPPGIRTEPGIFDLRRPGDSLAPVIDAPKNWRETGEKTYRDEYFRIETDREARREAGWHRLQWCGLAENTLYCETVANIPIRHETGFVGPYESWSGERPVLVARPRDHSVYYVAEYYAGASREGAFRVPKGAVYRYDRRTGRSFRIADIGMEVAGFGEMIFGVSLSPDGKRLVFVTESKLYRLYSVNVLNLDAPGLHKCGTPVDWIK